MIVLFIAGGLVGLRVSIERLAAGNGGGEGFCGRTGDADIAPLKPCVSADWSILFGGGAKLESCLETNVDGLRSISSDRRAGMRCCLTGLVRPDVVPSRRGGRVGTFSDDLAGLAT